MAAVKRKAGLAMTPSKKKPNISNDRSAKRQRKSDSSTARSSSAKATAKSQPTPQSSIFKDEERSFPRGGASILTPFEHKQIQIQATQDVLFEQQTGQKRGGEGDVGGSGLESGEDNTKHTKQKSRQSKNKTQPIGKNEPRVRVEGLSYKRLVPGSMVLGQISHITSRDLVLALPNNLSGFVPLVQISDGLTARIEKLVDEQDSKSTTSSDSEEFKDIELKSLFYVGQFLRAIVTSTTEDASVNGISKSKKKIELSIKPADVNKGIAAANLSANTIIQAAVISNEDHGLVMDIGLESESRGFLSSNELGQKVDHSKVQEGAVFMCLVTGINSSGRIIKLSANPLKIGDVKNSNFLTETSSIDDFLPGTAVDLLVTNPTTSSVTGKIMGLLDATADLIHSGAAGTEDDLSDKYKIGSRVKARIICTFPSSDPKKVGVSLLDHILSLSSRTSPKARKNRAPLDLLPVSSIVEEATVIKVDPASGLYLDLGLREVIGFAHISRVADNKIERLSEFTGNFKVGSTHRARIVGYNPLDGIFQVSLEQKILDQPFLRIEDVKIGQVVKGKVEGLKLDKSGNTGVIVSLADSVTGLVPEMHLADVQLKHPERKFREGNSVTARVLSTDLEKRQIRLTLKKSLVNSEAEPWTDYFTISKGAKGPGTLMDVKASGALVQFYGNVRAWLPRSEISEAFIEDATQHFRRGQVVNVHVKSVDPEEGRMLVSCRDTNATETEVQNAFKSIQIGEIVQGTVVEKSSELVTVDLANGVRGTLRIGHLTDGSEKKDKSTMSRIRVGGPLEHIVVLDKHNKTKSVVLSNKPSLRKDAQAGTLISRFEDVHVGETIHGFVRGINPERIFIEFGGGVVGLLFKSQLADDLLDEANFGLRKDQSVTVRITHVDDNQKRFWLSMRSESNTSHISSKSKLQDPPGESTINAVDKSLKSTSDLSFGTNISARIRSIKSTQLNVHLADNVQGRVSVAEMFNNWNEIQDKKHPLHQFRQNQVIPVKILGMHDARNHRFLPITHRAGTVPVFELTGKRAKLTSESDVLSLDKITEGSSWIAYINNVETRFVWANLSANVRGRIELTDLSDDVSLLSNIEENFPIGSALNVRVKSVDASTGRLDLTASSTSSVKLLTWHTLKEGLILPARVTKVTDNAIIVSINESLAAPVYLEDIADDYEQAKPARYKQGEYLRVCVTEVDIPNKKLGLSTRPSKVLSSSLPVKDPEIKSRSQLKVNQIVRGFVKQVADVGLFVRIGHRLDAYIRVSDLSDAYLKDWKSAFQVDQLVKGKIISVNPGAKNVRMSLKASILEKDYVTPVNFEDMKVGQVITGKVRKVEEYGVFLVVDDSNNVSGLCHRSEIADTSVSDVKSLYKEGDAVKAKILMVDKSKRRITFGLKYSYITDSNDKKREQVDSEDDADMPDVDEHSEGLDKGLEDPEAGLRLNQIAESEDISDDNLEGEDSLPPELLKSKPVSGLSISGFDWTGSTLGLDRLDATSNASDSEEPQKNKKARKPVIKEDLTGNLDANGPQSVADYERLLLGQPNSAELWVRYMVFQRELNEIDKARQIASRALNTMNPREEKERLDVWTAFLHLENDFSSDDVVDSVFKEACRYNDSREVHERTIKIYISSGKLDKADTLYTSMIKNKSFTADPSLWLSYASFLLSTLDPPSPHRARALLSRATQSVPERQHRYLTSKFAALEFKSPNGDAERGRTIFEGLVSAWPKKGDLWDVYVDVEKSHGDEEKVRELYERMVKAGGKSRRIRSIFKKWREWEGSVGNERGLEKVDTMEKKWNETRDKEDEE